MTAFRFDCGKIRRRHFVRELLVDQAHLVWGIKIAHTEEKRMLKSRSEGLRYIQYRSYQGRDASPLQFRCCGSKIPTRLD